MRDDYALGMWTPEDKEWQEIHGEAPAWVKAYLTKKHTKRRRANKKVMMGDKVEHVLLTGEVMEDEEL